MYRHEKANTVCTVMCYDTRCYFSVRSKADTDTQQFTPPDTTRPSRRFGRCELGISCRPVNGMG